jgi:hypothetical protein
MPNAGSWNSWLSTFDVGERRYVETTLATYPRDMHNVNTPRSRRPVSMSGMSFSAALLTAVSARTAGDVRYLLCVERTE